MVSFLVLISLPNRNQNKAGYDGHYKSPPWALMAEQFFAIT